MRLFKLIKPLNGKIIWERRRYPRINYYLRTDYQIANDTLHSNCRTQDISEGGIRLNLYQRVEKGTTLKLGIYLQDFGEPAWVFGNVVWMRETPGKEYPYEAGIEFDFFNPSFRSRIQNHIQSIINEKNKLN
jgi:c-di-GMP-binding flagellar brake protein YcgR